MQSDTQAKGMNDALEDIYCVVCYENCITISPCCGQQICNKCSEEIAKRHEKPTCPTCRNEFKSQELSILEKNNLIVKLRILQKNKNPKNIYGTIELKPKTVKITQLNGKTQYIKYRKILEYGATENPNIFHSYKVNLGWQNWMNKSLTLKRINKEPKCHDNTIFNKIYYEEIMKYKIILKNELIEILIGFRNTKKSLIEIAKKINILHDKYQIADSESSKMAIKIDYSRLKKLYDQLIKKINIYKSNYWKWFSKANEKKLTIEIFNSLENQYLLILKKLN
jgi:hypothetical protein